MKLVFFTLAFAIAAGAVATNAEAQNYPWCAYLGKGGDANCGFVTFEQCMATLSGLGGWCNRNTQYVPAPGPHRGPTYLPPYNR
jgi:hypothetical protein